MKKAIEVKGLYKYYKVGNDVSVNPKLGQLLIEF